MKTYSYNGYNGILASTDNPKFESIKPLYVNNDQGFYTILSIKDIDVTDDDALITYDETYCGEIDEDFIPILCESVVNIENKQNLINEWVTSDYYELDFIQREFITITDSYYDWKSELSSFLESCGNLSKKEIKAEWNEMTRDIRPISECNGMHILTSEEIIKML